MPTKPPKRKGIKCKETASIYQSLPQGHSIRILILEPGDDDQMIFGRLEIINLDETSDFEAISYVWGSTRKRRTIFCNQVATRITQNLFEALRRIRHPSSPRAVWADAICINQGDDAEKSHQVALMGQIYSRSRRVLIHIPGGDEGHAPHVASLVTDVDSMVRLTLREIGLGFDHFPWPDLNLKRKAMEDSRWWSFTILSRKPWFQRGWVVQEAGLARHASILWGAQTEIEWQPFMRSFAWLCFRSIDVARAYGVEFMVCHEIPYFHRHHHEILAYGRALLGVDALLHILARARFVRFSDPKDRIFAFLDLDRYVRGGVDGSDGPPNLVGPLLFEPDYTRSTEEVYTTFASQYLQKRGVELLECVQHSYNSLFDLGLPSWVPRWDRATPQTMSWGPPQPLLPEPPPSPKHARHTYLGYVLTGGILAVSGVIFDTVEGPPIKFLSYQRYGSPPINVFALWRAVLTRRGRSYDSHDLATKFLFALTFGKTNGNWAEWWAAVDKYCTFLGKWAEKGELEGGVVEQLPASMQRDIDQDCWNQSLLFTSRDYFGLAPLEARKGDVLCIVFGCSTPFVLRQVGKMAKTGRPLYRLVGKTWVPGIRRERGMNGVGYIHPVIGSDESKDWVHWGLQKQSILIS